MLTKAYLKVADLLATVDPEEYVLVVWNNEGNPDENIPPEDDLGVFAHPDWYGTNASTYLVTGRAGTQEYRFRDMNKLGNTTMIELTIGRTNGQATSRNLWIGNTGNNHVPTGPDALPIWNY